MIEVIFLEKVQGTSFINSELYLTALLALLSALIVWLFKLSVENFQKESSALTEVQIALAINAEKLQDNEKFFDSWLISLKEGRLYGVQFHSLIFPYEKLKDVKSSLIVNQTLMSFYMCESLGKDLAGMHTSYYSTATSGVFKKTDDDNWLEFNENTLKNVSQSKISFLTIGKKLREDIDDIKTYITIRKKSFRYKILSLTEGNSVSKFEKQVKNTKVSSETLVQ